MVLIILLIKRVDESVQICLVAFAIVCVVAVVVIVELNQDVTIDVCLDGEEIALTTRCSTLMTTERTANDLVDGSAREAYGGGVGGS